MRLSGFWRFGKNVIGMRINEKWWNAARGKEYGYDWVAMKMLFVCSRNRLRSPSAEVVFSSYRGVEAMSAGTNADAEVCVSADLIEWAEIIFVMEGVHRRRLNRRFGSVLRDKKIVVLGIPDEYGYMDEALVELLRQRVEPHLRA